MRQLVLIYTIFLFSISCAVRSTPTGGPEDTRPPVLDSLSYSTPNRVANFNHKELIFTFDEWVTLENVNSQVVISPYMKEKPEIKAVNKSVVVRFKEPLKPNTTYSIKFGSAIKDITKGNVATGIDRVFSTGSKLDSIEVAGKAFDPFVEKQDENTFLLLYDNLNDTAVTKGTPLYVTKVDEQGQFKLEYIKKGKFQAIALQDLNFNLRYDEGEKIGFMDKPISLPDSTLSFIQMKMFLAKPKPKVLSSDISTFGRIDLETVGLEDVDVLNIKTQPDKIVHKQENLGGGKWRIWYKEGMGACRVMIQEGELKDTLYVNLPKRKDVDKKLLKPSLEKEDKPSEAKEGSRGAKSGKATEKQAPMHPEKDILLKFNYLLTQIDTSKITLRDSSGLKILSNAQIKLKGGEFAITHPPMKKGKYELILLPNALTTFLDVGNDTIKYLFQVVDTSDFGQLTGIVKDMEPQGAYILELLDEEGKMVETNRMKSDSTYQMEYKNLPLGKYKLRVVTDLNQNGRWDTGDFSKRRQPEPILLSDPIEIKTGIDAEMAMELKPKNTGKGKRLTPTEDKGGKGK